MTLSSLVHGELTLLGRVRGASNHTFVCDLDVGADTEPVRVVYKPIAGERPLWDFPDGNLAFREMAAVAVDAQLGWGLIPPTVFRDGPHGDGIVQVWCQSDGDVAPVDVVPVDQVPAGYIEALRAEGVDGRLVSVVHEDSAALKRIATLDLILNNTDRKGGHILAEAGGHRWAIDHGICFHSEPKLRTVLWGWAGQPVPPELLADVTRLLTFLQGADASAITQWLTPHDARALNDRVSALLHTARFPESDKDWPAIPWPPF